jgi:hypothetical protein
MAMAWLGESDNSMNYPERLALIKERAKGLGEPARSAFLWLPDGTEVHKADISYWISQPWNNRKGRLTLVGDAAHPMPPCELPPFFSLPLCLTVKSLSLSLFLGTSERYTS